jgi:hypothetical protein
MQGIGEVLSSQVTAACINVRTNETLLRLAVIRVFGRPG